MPNASGKTLFVQVSDALNNGTMQASGGGRLQFLNSVVSNTSTIQALSGSVVQINNSAITGGALTTASTGVITNVGGTAAFDGITNTGSLNFNESGPIQFRNGTITNNSAMTLSPRAETTRISIFPQAM